MKKFVTVIQARYKSLRFPGKPLTKIEGLPMIYRVWKQCLKATKRENVFDSTNDLRIVKGCKNFQLTSSR